MATTLTNLIDSLRFQTNMEESQFVTDSELTGYLNSSLAELDDILVDEYDDYKITPVTLTISSNVDGYNYFYIPSDFLKGRLVEKQINGQWKELRRFNLQAKNRFHFPLGAVFGDRFVNLQYRLLGDKVYIEDFSQAAGTYQLWYVPKFTPLTDGYSTLPAYMDAQSWCEYAVADSAIKVLDKQNLDPAVFMARKEALKQRIIKAASSRDAGPPKVTVDSRSRNRFGRFPIGRW